MIKKEPYNNVYIIKINCDGGVEARRLHCVDVKILSIEWVGKL